MRFALALSVAVAFAVAPASAADAPLEELGRFIATHYCVNDDPHVEVEISFTAPLYGAETTFLHFILKVTARDQYGQSKGDLLSGVVKYSPSGELEQLVIGGPRAGGRRLRDLRQAIRAARGWPKRTQSVAFGPGASRDEIGRAAAAAVKQLLGVSVEAKELRFHVMNPVGAPDGTWHVDLTAVESETPMLVKARVDPFTGRLIQVDVCRGNDC